jgi:hypothetical protein
MFACSDSQFCSRVSRRIFGSILILQQTSLPQHRRVIPLNALAGELVASKASEHFCQQLGYKARFYFDARVQRHIHKLWRLHSWYTT